MSIPVPSPSMYGMMGWSGTFRDMSGLTVIFWPWLGTLMCWYMETAGSGDGKAFGPGGEPVDSSPRAAAALRVGDAQRHCMSTELTAQPLPGGFPKTGSVFRKTIIDLGT